MISIQIKKPEMDYFCEEAYKSLRTNLLLCGSDKKVIALTSCTSGEGKSSVSLSLGISLAEAGKRVLLIEADMRKPVLAGRLGVTGVNCGLSHVLAGQAQMKDAVCAADIPDFYVMFAGAIPPNPTELLGNDILGRMIRALNRVYDYIIIDTPPLGRVIDCAVAARYCDGIILVVEADAISYRFAKEVKQQLEKTNCPVLGAVLNKCKRENYAYYGKYKRYGEYKRYRKEDEGEA